MKFRTLFFTIVLSTWLCPLFGNELYKSNVTASFYAEDFNGKATSSGETFDMNDYTCAHKSLPFNSILKVTNTANGNSVCVRVNDRGPFVIDREIDLSKAAAIQLGMYGSGTATVNLEIISRGPDTDLSIKTAEKALVMMQQIEAEAKKAEEVTEVAVESAETYDEKNWDIQLGAFNSKENANTLAQRLLKAGFTEVVFQNTASSPMTRVVIRNVKPEDVETLTKQLKNKGFGEYTVRKRANVAGVTETSDTSAVQYDDK